MPVLIALLILAPIAIFIRQFRQVRSGAHSKAKGTTVFFVYSLLPALLYILVCAALIGIEELLGVALVSEGLARSFFFVVGIAVGETVLLSLVFALAVFFSRQINTAA